jgi:crotonobetaine/carnitine-CoA ligase
VLALATGEDADAPGLDDVAGVESLATVLDGPDATVDVRLESPEDPLQIIYTSGTTGDPKGVVFPNSRFGAYAMLGYLMGYAADERPYTGLSLTHGNAQAITLAPSLGMGLRAVFSRRFTKSRLWDVCRTHGCTTFSLLGGMATAIYSEPDRADDADNPVRLVISAGMPAAIWEPFEARFGVRVFEWYAAVEGGLACKPIGEGPIGSFGKPLGLDMKILDDDDHECPPGEIGEICSRPLDGSAPEVEYHANPEASEAKTRGGWLRSGDMGHADADGWLFFDYRKGGGIRHNGDFVNTGFVEKVVAEHPSVTDVFAYGVPAASGAPGEKDVVVAIVPVDRVNFDPDAVFAACREGLESNFVPTYLQVVDEIPKTASEKPQERFLLDGFDPTAPSVHVETHPAGARRRT